MSAKATKGPYKITRGEIWSANECLGVVYRTEAWTSGEKVRTDDQATAALLAASWSMAEALESLLNASDIVDVSDDELKKIHDWGGCFGLSVLCTHLLNARAALRLAKGN